MRKMIYKGTECEVRKSLYVNNGNLALILLDLETDEMVATITLNLDKRLPKSVGYVKSYSENLGMMEALEEAGLIKAIVSKNVPVGFTTCNLVNFNMDGIRSMEEM